MSKAHAQKFIKQLQKDPALRSKVNKASQHIVKVAKDQGYDVTQEEISNSLKEHWAKSEPGDEPLVVFSEAPGF